MAIPIEEMKDLSRRSIFLAVTLAHPGDGRILVIPVEDFEDGLGHPAALEAHRTGLRFVSLLAICEDGALESVKFPGTFPAEIVAAAEYAFTELAIERGMVTPSAEA